MFGGGQQQAQTAPKAPDPPPQPPTFATSSVSKAGSDYGSRQKGGFGSTLITGGQGDLMPAQTAKKSLLGQ